MWPPHSLYVVKIISTTYSYLSLGIFQHVIFDVCRVFSHLVPYIYCERLIFDRLTR